MVKRLSITVLLILFCSEGVYSVAYADSAVLPKGRSRFNITSINWIPFEHRYSGDGGKRGNVEDIATDFNVTVDENVFPDLEAFKGAPFFVANPNLGESFVDFELRYSSISYAYQYGITDKLSAGIILPYWKSRNHVKSFLDTSEATIGKNSFIANLAPLPSNFFGVDTVPLETEDVLNLISGGIDINGDGVIDVDPGFGYKRFKTWHGSGIGDIEAGFKYQYLKTENWRLATTIGARFPTGKIDDPDNLVDFIPFTSGAYNVLFRLHNDYTGIKNLVLSSTIKYDLILQEKNRELRITSDVNKPITGNKERVRRDQGDIVELVPSIRYTPLKGFDISLLYSFRFKYKNDRISGDQGFAYESLERESAWKSHKAQIGLTYSTIPLYMEKKFPIPMSAEFYYNNKFAGRNNPMKSQFIRFGINFFF